MSYQFSWAIIGLHFATMASIEQLRFAISVYALYIVCNVDKLIFNFITED